LSCFLLLTIWQTNIGSKAARKMLVKLTTGVNFINIFTRIFCQYFGAKNYKSETFGFETFWQKDIGAKSARKMLVKLTTG